MKIPSRRNSQFRFYRVFQQHYLLCTSLFMNNSHGRLYIKSMGAGCGKEKKEKEKTQHRIRSFHSRSFIRKTFSPVMIYIYIYIFQDGKQKSFVVPFSIYSFDRSLFNQWIFLFFFFFSFLASPLQDAVVRLSKISSNFHVEKAENVKRDPLYPFSVLFLPLLSSLFFRFD